MLRSTFLQAQAWLSAPPDPSLIRTTLFFGQACFLAFIPQRSAAKETSCSTSTTVGDVPQIVIQFALSENDLPDTDPTQFSVALRTCTSGILEMCVTPDSPHESCFTVQHRLVSWARLCDVEEQSEEQPQWLSKKRKISPPYLDLCFSHVVLRLFPCLPLVHSWEEELSTLEVTLQNLQRTISTTGIQPPNILQTDEKATEHNKVCYGHWMDFVTGLNAWSNPLFSISSVDTLHKHLGQLVLAHSSMLNSCPIKEQAEKCIHDRQKDKLKHVLLEQPGQLDTAIQQLEKEYNDFLLGNLVPSRDKCS